MWLATGVNPWLEDWLLWGCTLCASRTTASSLAEKAVRLMSGLRWLHHRSLQLLLLLQGSPSCAARALACSSQPQAPFSCSDYNLFRHRTSAGHGPGTPTGSRLLLGCGAFGYTARCSIFTYTVGQKWRPYLHKLSQLGVLRGRPDPLPAVVPPPPPRVGLVRVSYVRGVIIRGAGHRVVAGAGFEPF